MPNVYKINSNYFQEELHRMEEKPVHKLWDDLGSYAGWSMYEWQELPLLAIEWGHAGSIVAALEAFIDHLNICDLYIMDMMEETDNPRCISCHEKASHLVEMPNQPEGLDHVCLNCINWMATPEYTQWIGESTADPHDDDRAQYHAEILFNK